MNKNILNEYIDACELVKETEQEIRRLSERRQQITQDNVKGSSHEFPYILQTYHLEGLTYSAIKECNELEKKEILLRERLQNADRIKHEVEIWLNTISARMQRIIKYKVFEKMTWEQVAVKLGRGATEASVKMEYQRFMNEK